MTMQGSRDVLADAVLGPVYQPGQDGYGDEVAGFNLATTHRPDVVVGATCTADVATAVQFAADAGMAVGVQCTGHGANIAIDGGMLITTRRMRELSVDPAARTATVGAGVSWRALIAAAAPHGLAGLCGSSSDVGVVGYTTGGGLPLLGRTFGYAADHVRRAEVVTADGEVHDVDADHEPELFWAIRGGKGNVGIVTSMVSDLVPVATLYGGGIFYAGDFAPQVLEAYRNWTPGLPERTNTTLALLRLPPLPEIPEPLRGQFVAHLRVAHVGDPAEGERLLAPMRSAAPVMIDMVGPMPYTDVDRICQDPDHPVPFCEGIALLRDLDRETAAAVLDLAGPGVQTPLLLLDMRHLGGALDREPAVPNAVSRPPAAFTALTVGVMAPPVATAVPGAVRDTLAALAPYSTGGSMVNLHGAPGDTADRGRCWSAEVYDRLRKAKAIYDPGNIFRQGHAVEPAEALPA